MSTDRSGDSDELEFGEELEDQWLAEWDEAERDAVQLLRGALHEHCGSRRRPTS